jgi:hypothetical protein
MSVAEITNTSAWQLLQTRDMPADSSCRMLANERQQHIWHAWNNRDRYCDYHHLGGLKAPVARVVANRRDRVVVMTRTTSAPGPADRAHEHEGAAHQDFGGAHRTNDRPPAAMSTRGEGTASRSETDGLPSPVTFPTTRERG